MSSRRGTKRKLEETELIFDLSVETVRCHKAIKELESKIDRDRFTIQGQRRIIDSLKQVLLDHGISNPPGSTIASFKTCRAEDDEVCPLSLHPINHSPTPYNPIHAAIDIEPRKPHHKCAQLQCGHRFNALWLLFHFVAQHTFRCPVCRTGPTDFHFELEQLPTGLLDRIREMRGDRVRDAIH
jgi:hypothetical protein